MAKCFVITCNDSVERVVLGTESQATEKLEELAHELYSRQWHHWHSQYEQLGKHKANSYEYYRSVCYWAARETAMTVFTEN